MTSSAALRQEIEDKLSGRVPGALTPQVRVERTRLSTGIGAIDAVTQGGFPVGAITEIGGVESSGRTTLAMAFLAKRVVEGMVFAWIDVVDSLDPESAAAAGVDLERMLWVRCGERQATGAAAAERVQGSGGAAMVDRSLSVPSTGGGCGGPHPRGEGRGLPRAIEGLMSGLAGELMGVESRGSTKSQPGGNKALLPVKRKDKSIGTPGAPNRVAGQAEPGFSWRSKDRVEQVATDRLPARRGDVVMSRKSGGWEPRCAEALDPKDRERAREATVAGQGAEAGAYAGISRRPRRLASLTQGSAAMTTSSGRGRGGGARTVEAQGHRPWKAIDQALRAADMLLQAGGFGVVVLDLGGVSPEAAWRIPMATWFRFRAAADRSRSCLVVLTQHSCARSSAELVLEMEPGAMRSEGRVMTGVSYGAKVGRQRFVTAEVAKVVAIRDPEKGRVDGADRGFGGRRPPQPDRTGAWHGTAAWAQTSGVDGVREAAGESGVRGREGRTG